MPAVQASTKNSTAPTPAQQPVSSPATALSSVLGDNKQPPAPPSIIKLTNIITNQRAHDLERLMAENFTGVRPDVVVAWQALTQQMTAQEKVAFIQGCKQQLIAQETKKWTVGLGLTGVIGIILAACGLMIYGNDLSTICWNTQTMRWDINAMRGDTAAIRDSTANIGFRTIGIHTQLTQDQVFQHFGPLQPTIAGRLLALQNQGVTTATRLGQLHAQGEQVIERLGEIEENTRPDEAEPAAGNVAHL